MRPQMRGKRREGAGNDPRIRAEEIQRQCDSWNILHPVGSPVTLHKDSGEQVQTKTRSEAYVCESGYAVIFLEGVAGYYLLKRVERRSESEGECHIRPHDLCSAGTCKVCVDAARYRWLQDNGVLVLDETLTGDALDIAVDAERRHALQIANSVDCTQCPHPDACEASGGCPKIEGGDGG